MATIDLLSEFENFILARRFPHRAGGADIAEIADEFAKWNPDLGPLMPPKRIAKMMVKHPWIDRFIVSGPSVENKRYNYRLARCALDEINERIRKQDRIL